MKASIRVAVMVDAPEQVYTQSAPFYAVVELPDGCSTESLAADLQRAVKLATSEVLSRYEREALDTGHAQPVGVAVSSG